LLVLRPIKVDTHIAVGKGPEGFPCDLDTTSVGLMVMERDEEVVHSVMDEMLEYIGANGLIQVSN